MFFLWTLIPALYVVARFVILLPLPLLARLAIALVVLLGSEFHLIGRVVFGNMFSPEWPHAVMVALGWLFGCVLLLACLLILRDVVALLFRLFLGRKLPFLLTALPLLLLAGGLAAWGVQQATRVPDVRVVNVTLPGLPQAFEGYRIIQLSDIHASSLLTGEWVAQVVAKTNARKADLIVLTGDMSDGYVPVRRADVAPLGQLTAKDGLYAITGNHEYYFNYDQWMKVWAQSGVPFLLNSHVRLYRDNAALVIAGVTDEKDLTNPPNVSQALAGTRPDDTVILLDHRPGNARDNARHNVKLQLSGHTHGGMIRPLEFAIKPANNGFVSGRYQVGNMQLYVSNGAGLWNGFPLRIGRPSEITELVLHRQ